MSTAPTLDIDSLEAGRELDALIAERVMKQIIIGWGTAGRCEGEWSVELGASLENRGYYTEHAPLFLDCCGCDYIKSQERPEAYGQTLNGHYSSCLGVVPYYSTDIAAAWQVVEKLKSDKRSNNGEGCCLALHYAGPHYVASFDGCPYDVDRFDENPETFPHAARAETAPLAICRAALKATGVT